MTRSKPPQLIINTQFKFSLAHFKNQPQIFTHMKTYIIPTILILSAQSVFPQTVSQLLVLDPPKPFSFTKPNDICGDFQRQNNAILMAPMTGSPASSSVVSAEQTKLLKDQNSILNSQLLIMQGNLSDR
jgi:hypothetical protein